MKDIEIISKKEAVFIVPGWYMIGFPKEISTTTNSEYRLLKLVYDSDDDLFNAREELSRFSHDYFVLQSASEKNIWACEIPIDVKVTTYCEIVKLHHTTP